LFTPIIHHRLSFINSDGFTLIELLVVISIIAMLMAILLPTLGRVRKQVKAVACQANLRQWGQIFKMHTDDHEGWWFRPGLDTVHPWFLETFSLWYDSPSIAVCPMTTKWLRTGSWDAFTVCRPDMYFGTTPAGTRVYGPFSYGFNEVGLFWRHAADPTKEWESCWCQTCDVRGASNVPVFFDCAYSTGCGEDHHGPPPNPWIPEYTWYPMCIDRHNGGINMLFLDWSVRKVGLKELWTLQWHRGFDTANAWTRRGGVEPEDWPQWMRGFKNY